MREALIFNGLNALDFQDIRFNVIRIPEVVKRLREAQMVWDVCHSEPLDLANFVASDDRVFLGNIRLKSLAAAVVQMGLYDRYLRFSRRPDFLVGSCNGDSALYVAAGKISFEEMVENSLAARASQPLSPVFLADAPVLSGISLTEYGTCELKDGLYEDLDEKNMDIVQLVRQLIDEKDVRKLVSVGPGNMLLSQKHEELSLLDIQILESIDLDPMLSWFWASMRELKMASAQ